MKSVCSFKFHDVLIGSGLIVPISHRENVFDLTEDEWNATFSLLKEVKALLDENLSPDGYNVGWMLDNI
ncbi:hypothetical protein [Bacillus sp. Cr_A10]|uniref:HIT family protein n=1 Tax=Bacillus sp. Cr_A10 TaxID=3033993 RepID=UPI0031F3673E